MPLLFNEEITVKSIMGFISDKAVQDESLDCLYDYVDKKFGFVKGKGKDCDKIDPVDLIGANITKRAIKEMRKRFADSNSDDEIIFSIDYGKPVFLEILKNDKIHGIRFYFGYRNIDEGKNFISLILVGIDKDGTEIIKANLGDGDSAGTEVGHGNKNGDLKKKGKEKFKIAHF